MAVNSVNENISLRNIYHKRLHTFGQPYARFPPCEDSN
jgi:hypothetical protein